MTNMTVRFPLQVARFWSRSFGVSNALVAPDRWPVP